jgi:hypothetical protein
MPRKAKPPSLPGLPSFEGFDGSIVQLAQEIETIRELAFRVLPGWAEGIILGLLVRASKKEREALAECVDELIWDGPGREASEGREEAKAHARETLRALRFDRRQGRSHPEALLRWHGRIVWNVLENGRLPSSGAAAHQTWPPYRFREGRRLVSLDHRRGWLHARLPSILGALRLLPCNSPTCVRMTRPPKPDQEEVLSGYETFDALAAAIVAYHHGLTPVTVTDRFSRRYP